MKQYKGKLMVTRSPTGNMLYGDKTDKEKKNENKKYQDNRLNESKKGR